MNIWERVRGMADHHRLVLVFAILEVLTLLRKACENEHYDEVRVVLLTLLNVR